MKSQTGSARPRRAARRVAALRPTTPASVVGRMWGGRFARGPSPLLSRVNDSFAFDRALLAEDVEASIAWAAALSRAGALTRGESGRIIRGLRIVVRRAAASAPAVGPAAPERRTTGSRAPEPGYEDVHTYIESALASIVGPLAGKLHTGRSRNDQAATDLRLYLRRAVAEARRGALVLAGALARRAVAEAATPMPGYTHLRQAEPITFGHWCHAYCEMLLRDVSRLADAAARADECPLGCGALSGTPVPVDRARLAASLGFARASANSLDAVSDRDPAADYLFAASMMLAHLSRLAEDLIFFGSDEVGFVTLPDSLATGSSRMPHKKNPDLLELARGHAARCLGDLTGLMALIKGLPLAYNKDLQLDKEPVFRTRETLAALLPALAALVEGLKLDRRRMREAASSEGLLASGVADAMAARGVPFREAHATVGRRLAQASRSGGTLASLEAGGGIRASDLRALDVTRSLRKRSCLGGTSPARVRLAARAALRRIERLLTKGGSGGRPPGAGR